jgi:hypothetical protein
MLFPIFCMNFYIEFKVVLFATVDFIGCDVMAIRFDKDILCRRILLSREIKSPVVIKLFIL